MSPSARLLSRLLVFLFFHYLVQAQEPPKLRLPDTVAPTSYKVQLTLDPGKDAFSGEIAIRVQIKQPTDVIWLNATDIHVEKSTLVMAGETLSPEIIEGGSDFVGLRFKKPLATSSGELTIRYTGKVHTHNSAGVFRMEDNGNRYLFTQFESTDARTAFPCFDEPSYKVPWQLTLDVPSQDSAISNTSPENESARGDRKVIRFKETKPLPSYLVAFAVGPLEFVDAGKAGRNHVPVRIVTPKGHADEAKYAAEVTATIITRLEEYFDIPFPYDKSDQVAIPVTFGFGAMENAGMVTYAQTIILAKPGSDTIRRQREYASVAAHELAHQWFGDLVTTAWWNDIWLNEAFATWMEQKLIAEWKPEWNTRVDDVESKLDAEREDSLISARKIRQEINSKDDISNAFDEITYQKGAAVIGMFESWIGAEEFRKGVRSYLTQYAFRNATAPEFLDSVSSASGKNITQAFSSFLNQAGVPLVSVSMKCNGSTATLHLEEQRFLPLGSQGSADQQWQIPVCVRTGRGEAGVSECTLMTQPARDWTLKASGCPAWLQSNDKAIGYYRVNYEGSLLTALAKGAIDRRLSAPERVDFMGNAESLANAGKLPIGNALSLVETFHNDTERQVIQSALSLALVPRTHLVPENLLPNYQRFLQRNFDPRARELGWEPKSGESDNVRLLRPSLLRAAATYAGDETLARQAEALTEKWFNDPKAIDPNMLSAVLSTSAYHGDVGLQQKFVAAFKKSHDRQEQQRIIGAMQSFRDPAAIKAGMNAVISGQIPMIQGFALLFAGQGSQATRKMPFEFLKEHYDQIVNERPTGGGFDFGSVLPQVGASYCDPESKRELQAFFEPRVQNFTGAPRALSQVLESIDVCIAEKATQEAGVEAFLKRF